MDYSTKTRDELRIIAKELKIVGRGTMTKSQLVEAIRKVVENNSNELIKTGEQLHDKVAQKLKYVENAEVGTIVAFRLPNGKVKSAAIEKRSTKRRVLQLVTSYGKTFVVSFDDVVWVKTGTRWPKGIFDLLKGNATYEADE